MLGGVGGAGGCCGAEDAEGAGGSAQPLPLPWPRTGHPAGPVFGCPQPFTPPGHPLKGSRPQSPAPRFPTGGGGRGRDWPAAAGAGSGPRGVAWRGVAVPQRRRPLPAAIFRHKAGTAAAVPRAAAPELSGGRGGWPGGPRAGRVLAATLGGRAHGWARVPAPRAPQPAWGGGLAPAAPGGCAGWGPWDSAPRQRGEVRVPGAGVPPQPRPTPRDGAAVGGGAGACPGVPGRAGGLGFPGGAGCRVGEDEAKLPVRGRPCGRAANPPAVGGPVGTPLQPVRCRAAPHAACAAGPLPTAPRAGRDSPCGAGAGAGASWRRRAGLPGTGCRARRQRGDAVRGPRSGEPGGMRQHPGVTRLCPPRVPRPAAAERVQEGPGMLQGGGCAGPPSSPRGEGRRLRAALRLRAGGAGCCPVPRR